MSKKLFEETNIQNIANAIRQKLGVATTYTTNQMPDAILSIQTDPLLEILSVSQNGNYVPSSGYDGFSEVVVSVPSALPALSSISISENGTFVPEPGIDGFSEVVVSVPIAPSASLISKTFTSNGSYNAYLDDGVDGYSDVIIDVAGGSTIIDSAVIIDGQASEIINLNASYVRSYFYCSQSIVTLVSMQSVQQIGETAFGRCRNLIEVDFPACTSIGFNVFTGCSSISKLSFPMCEIIGAQAFGQCQNLSIASFPACTTISTNAFSGCSNLREVYFPECTTIGTSAFSGCSNLSEVYFPECTTIGASAFLGCSNLREVYFPECTSIGSYAFYSCTNLSKVYLLSSIMVSSIASTVFRSTPIANSSYLGYFGSIYVPSSLVEAYKAASGWSYYSDRITAYTG